MHRYLTSTANRYPDRIAVCEGDREFTYAELAEKTGRIAAALRAAPLSQEDRVVIAFGNVIEFIFAYFGVLAAGGVPVLVRMDTPPAKLAAVIDDVEATGVLGHSRIFSSLPVCAPHLRFAFLDGPVPEIFLHIPVSRSLKDSSDFPSSRETNAAEKSPGAVIDADPETIIFTSGTSGAPKGVVLSAENLDYSTRVMVDYLQLTPDDRSLVGIPFSHCAGLLHMLAHIRCAGSLVTGENPALAGSFLGAVQRRNVTGLPVVPSLMRLLTAHYRQGVAAYCSGLRYVELSSEPCGGRLREVLMDLLPEVSLLNTYGLTEAPRATYHDIRDSIKEATSVGGPNPGVEIRIVDHQGMPCAGGEIGEIIISGPNVASGYWKRPEKTAAAFTPEGFKTGDLARQDAAGRIYLKGRIDRRIKISGEWVSPEEVEQVITTLPGILKAEVFHQDDPASGTILCARIMALSEAVDERRVVQACRMHLEKYKIPTRITFTEAAAERKETVAG